MDGQRFFVKIMREEVDISSSDCFDRTFNVHFNEMGGFVI